MTHSLVQYSLRFRTIRARSVIQLVLLFLLVVAGVWATSDSVHAHASFEESDPEPNSIQETSPDVISISFTEPLEFGFSEALLLDAEGNELPEYVSEPGDNDHSLQIPIDPPLDDGTYSVSWTTLSTVDGHIYFGFFTFTIGSEEDATDVAAPTSGGGGPPLWLQAASRWIVYLAIAPIIASWIIWLLVLVPATSSIRETRRALSTRVRGIVEVAFLASVVGNVVALLVQADTLVSGSLSERIWDTLTDTRYGTLWRWRLILLAMTAVLLWAVDWMDPGERRLVSAVALFATLLVGLPISMNAHAGGLDVGRSTAVAFDWVHLTSASIWFGGLILIFGALAPVAYRLDPEERRSALSTAFPRYSAVAIVCWGLLAVTGGYAAWLQVGSLDALLDTTYGRSLAGKLLLLSVVLMIAAVNLLVLTRRMSSHRASPRWSRRFLLAVGSEIALAIVVFFLVGRMTSLQPARDAHAVQATAVSVDLLLDEEPATLEIEPATAGSNLLALSIDTVPLPSDTEAVVRPVLVADDLRGKELQLIRGEGNTFSVQGSELGIAGTWDLEVIVRQIGGFSWEGTTTIAIAEAGVDPGRVGWTLNGLAMAGLVLAGMGIGGLVAAWLIAGASMRRVLIGVGVAALVVGVILLTSARVEASSELERTTPVGETVALPKVDY